MIQGYPYDNIRSKLPQRQDIWGRKHYASLSIIKPKWDNIKHLIEKIF